MTKWARLTINIDPPVAKAAKERAKEQRRSFAAYVATLIEKDLEEKKRAAAQQVEEPHVVYDTPAANVIGPRILDSYVAGKVERNPPATGSPRKPSPTRGGQP